jgi:hypothetical protein
MTGRGLDEPIALPVGEGAGWTMTVAAPLFFIAAMMSLTPAMSLILRA